ncbi:delta(1)-pyrroline-2-carboxylate reductase family protein [Methylibium sp.]|uniref:delta(1)-pyrroline-2-carboxylate reductase family protein n=1 Tax=Methylibium sp. TaxID=2067992 RepID=UPI003D12B7D9
MPDPSSSDRRAAMQTFDAPATRTLLPAAALVSAVAAAMRARRAGKITAPERLTLSLPGGGRYLVMPAADDELAITKLVAVHPANPARGLPTIHAQLVVADARDGRALMLLDGPTVTARRTAAVTALGLRVLGASPVRSVALLGTGAQALEHARLLAELGEVSALHLVGRTRAQAEACAEALGAELGGVTLTAHATLAGALDAAQAVVTLTTSLRPVLPEHLPAALLVVGVGAFTPQMAELPPALLRSRRVIVDALEGARSEAGDLIQAAIDWSQVSELVDHLDEPAPAGAAPVFKTVGQAAWDLAAAHVAHRMLATS